jgi:hypothetical protein
VSPRAGPDHAKKETDNKESEKTEHTHMEINENATKNKHKLETA